MEKARKVLLQIETSRAWGRGLLSGIAKYSRLHGPWGSYRISDVYLIPSKAKGKKELTLELEHLKTWGAEGIITRQEAGQLDILIDSGLPIIVTNDSNPTPHPLPRVISNYDATGKMGAQYFLDRGFSQFAFCGYAHEYWSRERLKGFIQFLKQIGHEVQVYKEPRLKSMRSWQNEPEYIATWIKSLPKPIGIMTACDIRSQHVLEACGIAGIHVPEEVAILGVDNDEPLCDLSHPTLSSIALNAEGAGYEAAKLLDELMSGQESMNGQIIVAEPTHVANRQSTDILAVDDREVVKALRFIRTKSKQSLQVHDVAEAVAISRRSLEQRFRKILGRSVLQEIRRVRVDQFARLLVETNLSIPQIAADLDFSGVDNVGRYFQKETGYRPQTYRKKFGRK